MLLNHFFVPFYLALYRTVYFESYDSFISKLFYILIIHPSVCCVCILKMVMVSGYNKNSYNRRMNEAKSVLEAGTITLIYIRDLSLGRLMTR